MLSEYATVYFFSVYLARAQWEKLRYVASFNKTENFLHTDRYDEHVDEYGSWV